jgi:hypothetical protein
VLVDVSESEQHAAFPPGPVGYGMLSFGRFSQCPGTGYFTSVVTSRSGG